MNYAINVASSTIRGVNGERTGYEHYFRAELGAISADKAIAAAQDMRKRFPAPEFDVTLSGFETVGKQVAIPDAPSGDEEVVATIEGKGVTRAQLREAFAWVEDKAHWKNPIDKVVSITDVQKQMVREAVVFFTGSVPTFTPIDDRHGNRGSLRPYRVRAAGYYSAVGA